jgi:hypothetical protein
VRIHVNAISRDDITQKIHFILMEFTFLQFGIKSNFLELLQDKTYMAFVVLHILQENKDVIDVIDHEIT